MSHSGETFERDVVVECETEFNDLFPFLSVYRYVKHHLRIISRLNNTRRVSTLTKLLIQEIDGLC